MHGITRVSVAGHPEGHPYLDEAAAFRGLEAWRDWGRETGIRVDVVTQFCFEAAPILKFLGELAAQGIQLPVTIGLGNAARFDDLEIIWPGGQTQKITDARIDGLTIIEQAR